MDDAYETTDPKRRRLLGLLVMAGILWLQLSTEYIGTHDTGRFLLKAVTLVVGLPLLVVWAFAVFRWASRRRFGTLGPLFVGAVVAGLVFAGLLWVAREASFAAYLAVPLAVVEELVASRALRVLRIGREQRIAPEHLAAFSAEFREVACDDGRTKKETCTWRSSNPSPPRRRRWATSPRSWWSSPTRSCSGTSGSARSCPSATVV